jgi:hypothetical protein
VHGVIFLGDCVITASHDRTIKVLPPAAAPRFVVVV